MQPTNLQKCPVFMYQPLRMSLRLLCHWFAGWHLGSRTERLFHETCFQFLHLKLSAHLQQCCCGTVKEGAWNSRCFFLPLFLLTSCFAQIKERKKLYHKYTLWISKSTLYISDLHSIYHKPALNTTLSKLFHPNVSSYIHIHVYNPKEILHGVPMQ